MVVCIADTNILMLSSNFFVLGEKTLHYLFNANQKKREQAEAHPLMSFIYPPMIKDNSKIREGVGRYRTDNFFL